MRFHYFDDIADSIKRMVLSSGQEVCYALTESWRQPKQTNYVLSQDDGLMELTKYENNPDYFEYPGKVVLRFEDMDENDVFYNQKGNLFQKDTNVNSVRRYVKIKPVVIMRYTNGLEERLKKLEAHMKEHLLYMYGGEGYRESKADFEERSRGQVAEKRCRECK